MLMAEWVVLNKGKLNIGELASSDYVETRMSLMFGEFEAPNLNNLYGDILKKLWDDYIYRNLFRLQNFYNEVYVERITSALNYKNIENEKTSTTSENTNVLNNTSSSNGTQVMGEVTKTQTDIDSDVAYNSMQQKDRHKKVMNSIEPETTNTNSTSVTTEQNNTSNGSGTSNRDKTTSGFTGKSMTEMLIESNKQFLLNPIDDFIDSFCKYNLYYLF